MNYLFQLTHSEDYSHMWDIFFVHMSILQTVAMATNNRKDNRFFAIFHLFASFSRVSFGKIS